MIKEPFSQYEVIPPVFDGFSEASRLQEVLGSVRTRRKLEAASISSTNYRRGISGWKLTPSSLEFAKFGAVVPAQVPEFIGDIYINTATSKIYIAKGLLVGDWIVLN